MSKLTYKEWLREVMDDPHEAKSVKDAIIEHLKECEKDLEKELKREDYWRTYSAQQYNEFQRQLNQQKEWHKKEISATNWSCMITTVLATVTCFYLTRIIYG